MPIKLTKRSVDALVVEDKRRWFYDSELPGFGVAVSPSGVRTFFAHYRGPGGRNARKQRLMLGRYGTVTVEEARDSARKVLADVTRGGDPASSRAARKTSPTIENLGKDYLDQVDAHKKPRTAKEYRRLWDRHVVPEFGQFLVEGLSTAPVSLLHRRMRKTPYLANRVLALLGAFFTFAERQGVRARHTDPTHGIDFYKEHSRERFLTPAEVKKLGEALERASTTGLPPAPTRRRKPATGKTAKHRPKSADIPTPAHLFAVATIRFLLLTGFREREALTLKWSEIDLGRHVAVLTDTKTGKSVRRIGTAATLLLDSLPRVAGSEYVFPGRDTKKPLVEINRVWYAVRHAAELDDVRLHDLRHSFASTVANAGGSLLMIRSLLGHKNPATTAKYAHLLADPVQATADATAAQLSEWLGSSAHAQGRTLRTST